MVLLAAGVLLREAGPGMLRAVHPTLRGAALLVLAGGGLTAAGLPRQAVAFAGGYVFGALPGGMLAMLAQIFGCLADYIGAHYLAGGWARRRLAHADTGRLARMRRLLDLHPFTSTLTLRLLPVSNNMMLNLLAGVAGVRLVPFVAGSFVGYVPQTAVFALLGAGVQVGRGVELSLGAALFVVSAALGMVVWRRADAPC